MGPSKLELLRQALAEIGEASAQELAAHLERRHGVKIEARYIPFLRASLREAEVVETVRQTARALAEQMSTQAQEKSTKTPPSRDAAPGPETGQDRKCNPSDGQGNAQPANSQRDSRM